MIPLLLISILALQLGFSNITIKLEQNIESIVNIKSLINQFGDNIKDINYTQQITIHNQFTDYVKRRTQQVEIQFSDIDMSLIVECAGIFSQQETINLNRTNQYPDQSYFNVDSISFQQVYYQVLLNNIYKPRECQQLIKKLENIVAPLPNIGPEKLNLDLPEEILFIDMQHNTYKFPKNLYNEEYDAKAFVFNSVYQKMKQITVFVDISSQNVREFNQSQYIMSEIVQQTFSECLVIIYYISNSSIYKTYQNIQNNFFTSQSQLVNNSVHLTVNSSNLNHLQIQQVYNQIINILKTQQDKSNKTFIITMNQHFISVLNSQKYMNLGGSDIANFTLIVGFHDSLSLKNDKQVTKYKSKEYFQQTVESKEKYEAQNDSNSIYFQKQNITIYKLQRNTTLIQNKKLFQSCIRDMLLIEYEPFISYSSYFSEKIASTNNNDNHFTFQQIKALQKDGKMIGVVSLGIRHNIVVEETITHQYNYQWQSIFFSSNGTMHYDLHSDLIPHTPIKQQSSKDSVYNKLSLRNKQYLSHQYGKLLGDSLVYHSYIFPRIDYDNLITNEVKFSQINHNIHSDLAKTVQIQQQYGTYITKNSQDMYHNEDIIINQMKSAQVTSANQNKTVTTMLSNNLYYDMSKSKQFSQLDFLKIIANQFDQDTVFQTTAQVTDSLSKYDNNITIRIPIQYINIFNADKSQQLKKRGVFFNQQLMNDLKQLKISDIETKCKSNQLYGRLDTCLINISNNYKIEISYQAVFYMRLFRYAYYLKQNDDANSIIPLRFCVKSQIIKIEVCDKLFADEPTFDFYDDIKVHPNVRQQRNVQLSPYQFENEGCNCTLAYMDSFTNASIIDDIELVQLPDYRSMVKYSKFFNPLQTELIQEVVESVNKKSIFYLSNQFTNQDLFQLLETEGDVFLLTDKIQLVSAIRQFSKRQHQFKVNMAYQFEQSTCQTMVFDGTLINILVKLGIVAVSYKISNGQYCINLQLNEMHNTSIQFTHGQYTFNLTKISYSNLYKLFLVNDNISARFTNRQIPLCFQNFDDLKQNINTMYSQGGDVYSTVFNGGDIVVDNYKFSFKKFEPANHIYQKNMQLSDMKTMYLKIVAMIASSIFFYVLCNIIYSVMLYFK